MDFEAGICMEEAVSAFDFGGEVLDAPRYGEGHINDTFALTAKQPGGGTRRFILQRVNTTVFHNPEALMDSIMAVTQHLRAAIVKNGGDPDRETLTVLPTKAGKSLYRTADGGAWRAYLFVEDAVSFQRAETPELFHQSARAFGNFFRLLSDFPAETLFETIPHFHDTPERYAQFEAALAADPQGRAAGCAQEIGFVQARKADCSVMTDMQAKGELPLRVTHNDTKLNNVLLDPDTLQPVCVIDLDTVMPGLLANDYGDSIRFGASTAAEDEQDLEKVQFSLPLFQTYTRGYLETAGAAMTPKEVETLAWGARLMTLECGMRFLADHLNGDVYFKVHRPNHNLDRCRTQFKLVVEMEAAFEEMNAVVQREYTAL